MGLATESLVSALSYVGARPYIRGADVFRCFERFARAELPQDEQPVRLRSLKLHREVERDGVWRIDGELEGASATLDYSDAGGRARNAVFVESAERITRRAPDIASRVAALEPAADFAGSAEFAPVASSADWLDALIEANKALHVHTLRARGLPTDRIRFIYVEELPWLAREGQPAERVLFRHLGARPSEGRLYTLNQVVRGGGATLKLCYSC